MYAIGQNLDHSHDGPVRAYETLDQAIDSITDGFQLALVDVSDAKLSAEDGFHWVTGGRYSSAKLTEEQTLAIIEKAPSMIPSIEIWSDAIIDCAIRLRADALKYAIVYREITDEQYLTALRAYGQALEFMPRKLLTSELCLDALKRGASMNDIPIELMDYEICKILAHQHPTAVSRLPHQADEIYEIAVKARPDIIKHTVGLLTDQVILLALSLDGLCLEFVPEPTTEMCDVAIGQNGRALQYVPMDMRTYELCLKAIRGGARLTNVPDAHRDSPMRELALQHNGEALYEIKDPTFMECITALQNRGDVFDAIPEGFRVSALLIKMAASNGGGHLLLQLIPDALNEELLAIIVKSNPDLYHRIPEVKRTWVLYELACAGDPRCADMFPKPLYIR